VRRRRSGRVAGPGAAGQGRRQPVGAAMVIRQTTAPVASRITLIRPTPGRSNGSRSTWPPRPTTLAVRASTSSTAMWTVIHVILDDYAAHKHPSVRKWLARPPAGWSTSRRPRVPGGTSPRPSSPPPNVSNLGDNRAGDGHRDHHRLRARRPGAVRQRPLGGDDADRGVTARPTAPYALELVLRSSTSKEQAGPPFQRSCALQ
jgi:hypothetical protein